MTNKCIKELEDFINVFQIYPDMFWQVDYDPSSVDTKTGHTGRIITRKLN
jgi:hypothetical protein